MVLAEGLAESLRDLADPFPVAVRVRLVLELGLVVAEDLPQSQTRGFHRRRREPCRDEKAAVALLDDPVLRVALSFEGARHVIAGVLALLLGEPREPPAVSALGEAGDRQACHNSRSYTAARRRAARRRFIRFAAGGRGGRVPKPGGLFMAELHRDQRQNAPLRRRVHPRATATQRCEFPVPQEALP